MTTVTLRHRDVTHGSTISISFLTTCSRTDVIDVELRQGERVVARKQVVPPIGRDMKTCVYFRADELHGLEYDAEGFARGIYGEPVASYDRPPKKRRWWHRFTGGR